MHAQRIAGSDSRANAWSSLTQTNGLSESMADGATATAAPPPAAPADADDGAAGESAPPEAPAAEEQEEQNVATFFAEADEVIELIASCAASASCVTASAYTVQTRNHVFLSSMQCALIFFVWFLEMIKHPNIP